MEWKTPPCVRSITSSVRICGWNAKGEGGFGVLVVVVVRVVLVVYSYVAPVAVGMSSLDWSQDAEPGTEPREELEWKQEGTGGDERM